MPTDKASILTAGKLKNNAVKQPNTMDTKVIAALIAGVISVIGFLITFFATLYKINVERENIKKQLARDFTDKLYALRLEIYPEAFEITQEIGKKAIFSDQEIIDISSEARHKLKDWGSKKAALVLSERSLEAFYELKDLLSKNPGDGTKYTDIQIKNIWLARNKFRGSLRNDVGLLYGEEDM